MFSRKELIYNKLFTHINASGFSKAHAWKKNKNWHKYTSDTSIHDNDTKLNETENTLASVDSWKSKCTLSVSGGAL